MHPAKNNIAPYIWTQLYNSFSHASFRVFALHAWFWIITEQLKHAFCIGMMERGTLNGYGEHEWSINDPCSHDSCSWPYHFDCLMWHAMMVMRRVIPSQFLQLFHPLIITFSLHFTHYQFQLCLHSFQPYVKIQCCWWQNMWKYNDLCNSVCCELKLQQCLVTALTSPQSFSDAAFLSAIETSWRDFPGFVLLSVIYEVSHVYYSPYLSHSSNIPTPNCFILVFDSYFTKYI